MCRLFWVCHLYLNWCVSSKFNFCYLILQYRKLHVCVGVHHQSGINWILRTIDLASQAVCKFACPVLTIASRWTCLSIMSLVCTGSMMFTIALFCISLLISCPYFVPTDCTILPCWCASDLIRPCVRNWTHCSSGHCTTLYFMYWYWLYLCKYVHTHGNCTWRVHRVLVLLLLSLKW